MSFACWASRRGCQFVLSLAAIVSSALLSASLLAAEPAASPWEKEIRAFEAKDQQQPPPEGAVLFVGSSSIRLWKLDESFPDVKTINRGFGGSHLADSVAFAERIVIPYRPKLVVLYAGDNDLAAGKTPARVLADFKQFVAKVEAALPETRIAFISIKPCPKRRALVDRVRETNARIAEFISRDERLRYIDVFQPMLDADGQPRAELFREDGLHLSVAGYKLWADALRPTLAE
jgi:lysophospholipase L1-like esterase